MRLKALQKSKAIQPNRTYKLGCYYFPGWGTPCGGPSDNGVNGSAVAWAYIPEGEAPLKGKYNENLSSVCDRQLQEMRDFGLSFVVVDWYQTNAGAPYLNHWIDNALTSNIVGMPKICAMYVVHTLGDLTKFRQAYVSWNTYAQNDRYYRINGKPVVFIYVADTLKTKLGSTAAVKSALDEARVAGNFYFVGMGYSAEHFGSGTESLKAAGYDAISYYNLPSSSPNTWDGLEAKYTDYFQKLESAVLPSIVPVSTGFDTTNWSGTYRNTLDTLPKFESHLRKVKAYLDYSYDKNNGMAVIEAWNEYGEGGVLEPAVHIGGTARGLKVREIFNLAPNFNITKSVGLGVIGQSNEQGVGYRHEPSLGLATDVSAYAPMYFQSNDWQADPIAPCLAGAASMWPQLVDKLATRGIQAKVANAAIGSLSFIAQTCGQIKTWTANAAYNQKRTPVLTGDAGDKGDVIVVNGIVWRCTTGNNRYAFFNDATGITLYSQGSDTGNLIKQLNYIMYGSSNSTLLKTGATIPAALSNTGTPNGTTVADGGITWTLVSNTAVVPYNSYDPFTSAYADFDPLGVLARLKTNLDALTGISERWVLMSNGQSDVQGNAGQQSTILGWYQKALQNICDWAIGNSYKVAIGFTCANPTDENSGNGFRWVTLDSAWAAACASRVNGTSIITGANLYRALGISPKTYPQAGLPYGVHLTDTGMSDASTAWFNALIAGGF